MWASVPRRAKPVDVLVIGSSVAEGHCAQPGQGWAALLAAALSSTGISLANAAVAGGDTESTMMEFEDALTQVTPRADIVSLSLANEGLPWTSTPEDAAEVAERFVYGMRALAERVVAAGATPILGSVYPNDQYEGMHAQVLRRVHADLAALGWPTIDFLSALDDSHGRWRAGAAADAGHPNDTGHRLMFEAVDLGMLTEVCKRVGAGS